MTINYLVVAPDDWFSGLHDTHLRSGEAMGALEAWKTPKTVTPQLPAHTVSIGRYWDVDLTGSGVPTGLNVAVFEIDVTGLVPARTEFNRWYAAQVDVQRESALRAALSGVTLTVTGYINAHSQRVYVDGRPLVEHIREAIEGEYAGVIGRTLGTAMVRVDVQF